MKLLYRDPAVDKISLISVWRVLIVFILIAYFKDGFSFEVYKIEQLNKTAESSIEIIFKL